MSHTRMYVQSACAAAIIAASGLTGAAAQTPQTIAPASATPVPGPMPEILQKYAPVTAERLKKPEDGNWFHFRRTYDGWGFSPLKEITRGECRPAAAGLEHGDRPGRRPSGAADRQQRRDVRRHAGQPDARRSKPRPAICSGATSAPLPEDVIHLHPTNRGVALYGDKVYFAVRRLRAGRARRQDRQGGLDREGR